MVTAAETIAAAMPQPERGLRFSKMHGAGNDFVVLDLRAGGPPPAPGLCRALADRHVGVGCDQILTIEPARSAGAVAAYRIWNADGSVSQQCGNGARCVAAWLLRDGAAAGAGFALDSPAGTHAVERLDDGRLRIAMGMPDFAPPALPMCGYAQAAADYPLDVDGDTVRFGAVSMGNPHAVIEVDDLEVAPVARVGAALQRSGAFPESVNVGFAQIVDRGRIRLRVYERGVGETRACGSGACAAAVVLMQRDRIGRDVEVDLPGGTLRIAWPAADAQVSMAGPAAFVFEGVWNA